MCEQGPLWLCSFVREPVSLKGSLAAACRAIPRKGSKRSAGVEFLPDLESAGPDDPIRHSQRRDACTAPSIAA